jgi:hypothetical protein
MGSGCFPGKCSYLELFGSFSDEFKNLLSREFWAVNYELFFVDSNDIALRVRDGLLRQCSVCIDALERI